LDSLAQFYSVRLTLVIASVAAQLYIFFTIRSALLCSGRSERFKSLASWGAGLTMASLTVVFWFTTVNAVALPDTPGLLHTVLFYIPAVWNLGSIFSAGTVLLIQALRLTWTALIMRGRETTPGSQGRGTISPGRRSFLRAGAGGLAAAPFAFAGYGAFWEAKRFGVREVSIPFGRPLKAVQLSDIHAGHFMTRAEIRQCVERIKPLDPDLFFLTGDYVSNSMKFLPACLEELSRVHARYGTYACLGNHEHWYGKTDYLARAFERHGMRLLVNSHHMVQTDDGPLEVLGIPDLLKGKAKLEEALCGTAPGIPRILLSHRPEIFPRAAEMGIKLTLAGHYHGGQIVLKLPGISLSVADFKTDYPHGLFRLDGSYLYVSRGIGTTFTPVRLNAEPEITFLKLY
jgi:uncharacterized protein